jgi:hypothetical protein
MSDEKPLCGLVETRAYKHCLERREIWVWVLEAIGGNKWFGELAPGESSYAGSMIEQVKYGFDPAKIMWGKNATASEAAFDKWLKEEMRRRQSPALPKRRPGPKRTKRDAIAEQYKGDLPPDKSYKEIAKAAGASVSTVKRAVRRK